MCFWSSAIRNGNLRRCCGVAQYYHWRSWMRQIDIIKKPVSINRESVARRHCLYDGFDRIFWNWIEYQQPIKYSYFYSSHFRKNKLRVLNLSLQNGSINNRWNSAKYLNMTLTYYSQQFLYHIRYTHTPYIFYLTSLMPRIYWLKIFNRSLGELYMVCVINKFEVWCYYLVLMSV